MNQEIIQSLKITAIIWCAGIIWFYMLTFSAAAAASPIMIMIPGQLMVGSMIWFIYKCIAVAFRKEKK